MIKTCKYLCYLAAPLLLGACATDSGMVSTKRLHVYEGAERPIKDVAVIKSDFWKAYKEGISGWQINNLKAYYKLEDDADTLPTREDLAQKSKPLATFWHGNLSEAWFLPGKYVVTISCWHKGDGRVYYEATPSVVITAQAGRTYLLGCRAADPQDFKRVRATIVSEEQSN